MNPTLKKWLFKAGEWVGLFVTFGVIGSLWINTEVERRMGELLPEVSDDPAVVQLVTEMENVETTLARVETKVDAFSDKFLAYLERQAND